MSVEAVRQKVVEEHARLRVMVREMDQLAVAALKGQTEGNERLKEIAAELCRDLRVHIDREDEIVVPMLRERGLEGSNAAQQVTAHHAQQRSMLAKLAGELDHSRLGKPELLILLELAESLMADMAFEERHLLRDDALELREITQHMEESD